MRLVIYTKLMLTTHCRWFTCLAAALLLTGCMTNRADFDPPIVTVQSFRAVPGDGIAPAFEIGLRVVNPNRDALKIKGLAYSIALEGRPLLSGVGKDLPTVPGYSEEIITVSANASLYESFQLLGDLATQPKQQLRYDLETKLDVGVFHPPIRVTQSGEIALR